MHEGWTSTRLGMKGIPDVAESVVVARDALLAELTGGHAARGPRERGTLGRDHPEGEGRGIRMTAETAPHYLLLTEEAVEGFDRAQR